MKVEILKKDGLDVEVKISGVKNLKGLKCLVDAIGELPSNGTYEEYEELLDHYRLIKETP